MAALLETDELIVSRQDLKTRRYSHVGVLSRRRLAKRAFAAKGRA